MKRPMVYRFVLLTVLLWTVMHDAFCQDATFSLPFRQYTVADGLAQMQVRSVFIDRDGLVWIGTQGGLTLFDGSAMHPLNTLSPFDEEYIMSLTKGADRLFVSTIRESYAYDGKNITPLEIKNVLPEPHVLFEDNRQYAWFFDFNTKQGVRLYKNGSFHTLAEVYPVIGHLDIKRAWGNPDWEECYIMDKQNVFYVFTPNSGRLIIDSLTFAPTDTMLLSWNLSANKRSIIFQKHERFGNDISSTSELYRLSGDTMEHVATRHPSNGFLKPISKNAPMGYVGELNGVNNLFVLHDSVYRPDQTPPFGYIRYMVEANHKIYLGTDNGFVVIHGDGLENINYPACDYAWSVVPASNDDFYLGCYKTGIHHLSGEGHLVHHYPLPAHEHPGTLGDQVLSNFLVMPSAIYWGSNSGFLALEEHKPSLTLIYSFHSIEALATDPFNKSVLGGSDNIIWFPPDLSRRIDSMDLREGLLAGGYIHDMLITEERYLWVAAPGGIERIYLQDRSSDIYTSSNDSLPCMGAVTLEFDEAGNLWSGGTCGLMLLRFGTDRFYQVLPHLITQRVNQIALLKDNRLVCASNNNLYLLDISGEEPAIIAIYNQKNGLNLHEPSENGISVSGDRYVWLPSVSGIQRLDLLSVPEKMQNATLMILSINGGLSLWPDSRTEPQTIFGAASLLELSMIDHSGRTWQYQFQLDDGAFSPWQYSSEILVTGLQHGKNAVRIRASWHPSDPLTFVETDTVLYAHLPFFSRTNIQRGLFGLSIVLIGLIIASIIQSKQSARREEKLRSDLYRNRLRTIQAYLNPHFLFNTLTSIQDHILHQDAKAGNDMIVRLSRVFRKVLDLGRYDEHNIPMIRLSEEIALIKDIVYLNNKQLSFPVRFELQIDPVLENTDPLIPPMLIQPFVENAFKHAFTENTADNSIRVAITKIKDILSITILDNGIGYAPDETVTENSAMGTQLTQERMLILNALNVENSIAVEKIQPHGTLVTIKIKLLT